jgi:imidazolonepropionase-like amidohydrolase
MAKFLYYILIVILLLTGVGLLFLTNQGILSFTEPYARSLPGRLKPQNPIVAFQNVNVIPMDRERLLENQNVIVQEGIIEQIGPSNVIEIPAQALVVDGSGKYLMPGLVDMHVHMMNENELLLFAAHGVTSVRNMWGGMNFTDHLGWRAEIEDGEMFGPTIYTTGPVIEGPPKTMPLMKVYEDPASAAEAVSEQIEQGNDFIKVYDHIDLPTYEAIIKTTQDRGVMVVGHVPKKVGLEQAFANGQATIEHLSGFIDNDAGQYIVPEDELPKYAQMAANAGVYLCPTIAVYQMYVPKEDLHLLEERPEMAYISPGMKFVWQYFSLPGAMGGVTYEGDYPARINEMFLHTSRILHEHGLKFLLGTDSDNPYLVPGSSLLDELDYLVEAGFSPYEALETGTRNAAEAMGKQDEFGTIEPGKRADLILLDDNPLEDASATRERSGVMLRGRWLPESELQSYLDEVVDSFTPAWYERIWPFGLVAVAVGLIWRKNRRTHGTASNG